MLIQNPPVELTRDLWMLGANEYPLFLFRGAAEGVLFEGGTGAVGPLVLQQMDELGIRRDLVKQLVITHAHPDHVMAVPLFREAFPGVAVLASETAAGTLGNEKAVSFFAKIDEMLTGSLLRSGAIGDEHRPKPMAEKRIAVDRIIGEGDAIRVGTEAAFAVLATPGHSECSLSFHEAGRGILVISDATGYYIPEAESWWPNYFADYGTYVSSIERLAGLEAETLCLSHHGAIRGADDVAAYLAGALAATKAYHGHIIAAVRSGKSVRDVSDELGAEVHATVPVLPLEFFPEDSALLVKQSLRHEGISPEA